MTVDDRNVASLRKSLNILQNIPKKSYESSLFFDMLEKPVEDYMSEQDSDDGNNVDNKYKDTEITIDRVSKLKVADKICRICLGGDGDDTECDDDNPLFAPCVCSGTMKYVHLE